MNDKQSIPELNNLDFFNLDNSIDHSDIPNDDERSDPSPNRYGIPPSHSGSTSEPLHESEVGHSQVLMQLLVRMNDQDASKPHNLRRSSKTFVFPRNYNNFVVESKVNFKPKSFEEDVKHHHWDDAMNSKMDALYRNNTWELVELPNRIKVIGLSGFGKLSICLMGRCLINLTVQNGWTLYQMDVNNAFLYGDLNETVYMSLPPGYFPKDETRVCKLNKSLYGLKQAPRQWNAKLTSTLFECDDIIITGNNLPEINKFKQFLKTKFMIKYLGKLKYFLGIENLETPTGVCLNQRNEPKDNDPLLENVIDYQKLICKLIYLTTTRPDIPYTVSCLSQFMNCPLKSHLKTTLKVIRALASVTSKVVWVLKILEDLNCKYLLHVKVFCDNNSAVKIAANPIFHERTKHLEIDLDFVGDKVIDGVIKNEKIDTANQIVDILTKGLDIKQHTPLCSKLNLVDKFENKIKGGC
ncbi:ribonuclease H-like domain-containing protein [Tanacetum coccineum]